MGDRLVLVGNQRGTRVSPQTLILREGSGPGGAVDAPALLACDNPSS